MPTNTTRRGALSILAALAGSAGLGGIASAAGRPKELTLTRFATYPLGSEVTGLRVAPTGDMFLNVQHPSSSNAAPYNENAIGAVIRANGSHLPKKIRDLSYPDAQREKETLRTSVGQHQVLAHGSDDIGDGNKLGIPNDIDGNSLDTEAECDMNVFVPTGHHEGYLFTNYESQPGMISRMFISRGGYGAHWDVDTSSIENLNMRQVEGTWNNCNGSLSPWNTPLSSEEYEPTAQEWFSPDNTSDAARRFEEYLGYFANAYRYGWIVEITGPTGEATPVKRFALGRASHEVGQVVGDLKTVYLSDDYSGGVLYKFVADRSADLSSGTLYAAKLTQDATADYNEAGYDVEWVELAHGDENEIESWVAAYDGQNPSTDGYEPEYVTDQEVREWANDNADDDRVAFLETRKAAAAKGATNEWQKLEGLTVRRGGDPGDTLYIACSNIHSTMADTDGDMKLNPDNYGAVYGAKLDYNYDIDRIEPVVTGGPNTNVVDGEPADGDANPVNTLASPDNIYALDDGRVLFGEDTGFHENNELWMYDPGR